MFTHVSGRRILGRKRLHMFQEEGYREGNVFTYLRKKDIGKETFTFVSGRSILGRKCLRMFQERYLEGNVYSCFRKKDIGKEMFTYVSGKIFGRKRLYMFQEDGY